MSTVNSTQSHPRDLVAEAIHGPNHADALFRLLVLADGSTPKGAAFRKEAMKCAFIHTREGDEAVDQAAKRVAA